MSCAAAAAVPALTLAEALAYADAAHPDLAAAAGNLAVSLAEHEQAASRQDFYVYLEVTLSTREQSGGDWRANNIGRLFALEPLLDFGLNRTGNHRSRSGYSCAARVKNWPMP